MILCYGKSDHVVKEAKSGAMHTPGRAGPLGHQDLGSDISRILTSRMTESAEEGSCDRC